MTWGDYSAIFSNSTAPSTVAAAGRAAATGLVINLFSGKTALAGEVAAYGLAAQYAYSEMIQTPERAMATGTAHNATTAGVFYTVTAGTAGATGAANGATIGGTASAILAGVASATATARNAIITTPLSVLVPTLAVKIDWDRDGSFATSGDDVSAYLAAAGDVTWTRGRSSDFSGEATGSATFSLVNTGGEFSGSSPSVGTLVPGLPVLISNTLSGSERAAFYGFIQRVSWDPESYTATVTCYDMLKAFTNTEASFSISPLTSYSARDYRIALLSEYERGTNNVAGDNNPSFEDSPTGGWDYTSAGYGGATLTRVADTAPGCGGSWAGQWYAPTNNNRLKLFCRRGVRFEKGTVYTASVWLKATSGTPSLRIILGQDVGVSYYAAETVTLSTSWQQFTVRYTIAETTTASDNGTYQCLQFGLWAHTTAGFTVRVDGLMVNRGPIVAPFSALGSGRLASMCGNGSFDGAMLGGWYSGFTNYCGNPSFETNTTGWVTTTNSFVTASGASQTRTATGAAQGSYANFVTTGAASQGVSYAVTGTFRAGVTYKVSGYIEWADGSGPYTFGVGSSGTPTDYAEESKTTVGTGWNAYSATWTPLADRTDAIIYAKTTTASFAIDAVRLAESDGVLYTSAAASAIALPYATAGVTTPTTSATAKYGALSHSWTSLPVAGSGRLYDFGHSGAYFVSGRPYTVSVWIYPSSSMAYRVGIGASTTYGATWTDTTSTSGTAPADAWTRITLTWTPSADRASTAGVANVLIANSPALFIEQTDTTARTVLIDGVRVIPGSSPDEFELPQWSLGDEADALYSNDYQFANTNVGSGLSYISDWTLARHWVTPTLASPFYRYTTVDRTEQLALGSAESYADDNIYSLSGMELDLDGIVNLVEWGDPADYVYDQTSIDAYGQRPGLTSSGILEDASVAAVAAAMLARKKDPHHRPALVVRNRFASQLIREVNDVVTISSTRAGLTSAQFNIQSLTTKVAMGGKLWETVYQLEEM